MNKFFKNLKDKVYSFYSSEVKDLEKDIFINSDQTLLKIASSIIVLTSFLGIGWLAIAKTDEIIIVPGKIIPIGKVKEIKMRPGIDTHDYNVKVKALSKFIGGGNKVKVSMRFKGREMEHQNLGFDLLKKLTLEVEEYAKVEVAPKFEGRQIMMILVPQIAK